MTEKLLQYIWQFQYFNKSSLSTIGGEKIEIISQGQLNKAQGPDFKGALIRIGSTLLAGSVELHIKTSQWNDHGHQYDENYKNVILHVVYQHNENIDHHIPVLELQSLIPLVLLDRYENFMFSKSFIPCAASASQVKELVWSSWKSRLIAERLSRKSAAIFSLLQSSKGHWEEIFWWMIARNFGSKLNAEAFENMARSIPVQIIGRHKAQIHQLEALLLGQAGLLNQEFKEEYPKLLQREFRFLKKKYHLQKVYVPLQFMRMRPANFPSLRLAQLAALINQSSHLFSYILEEQDIKKLRELFRVRANDYWHYHYRLDESTNYKIKNIGEDTINNLLINTIVPVLFAYGLFHKQEIYKLKAMRWLEETDGETNSITRGFKEIGIISKTAYDTQSLIELKNQYCDARRCLQCSVGNALFRNQDHKTERAFL